MLLFHLKKLLDCCKMTWVWPWYLLILGTWEHFNLWYCWKIVFACLVNKGTDDLHWTLKIIFPRTFVEVRSRFFPQSRVQVCLLYSIIKIVFHLGKRLTDCSATHYKIVGFLKLGLLRCDATHCLYGKTHCLSVHRTFLSSAPEKLSLVHPGIVWTVMSRV